jgi:hypothetical protein
VVGIGGEKKHHAFPDVVRALSRAFSENPRRAGDKIWGKERVEPIFKEETMARIRVGGSRISQQICDNGPNQVYAQPEREVPMRPPRSGDWGKADLIGQPLAVSHENPRKLPG